MERKKQAIYVIKNLLNKIKSSLKWETTNWLNKKKKKKVLNLAND